MRCIDHPTGASKNAVRERSGRYYTMTGAELHDVWIRSAADRRGPIFAGTLTGAYLGLLRAP